MVIADILRKHHILHGRQTQLLLIEMSIVSLPEVENGGHLVGEGKLLNQLYVGAVDTTKVAYRQVGLDEIHEDVDGLQDVVAVHLALYLRVVTSHLLHIFWLFHVS